MSATTLPLSQITAEHLADAADCCKDAVETLRRVERLNPGLQLAELIRRVVEVNTELIRMKAMTHKNSFALPAARAATVFPVALPSGYASL
jgi:hypothetical protein